jgi:hypothetical protein
VLATVIEDGLSLGRPDAFQPVELSTGGRIDIDGGNGLPGPQQAGSQQRGKAQVHGKLR